MPTGSQIRDWLVQHINHKRYDDVNERHGPDSYDCSGATESGHKAFGVPYPDTSWQQARYSGEHHLDGMSIPQALWTPGAQLWQGARHGYDGFSTGGHVATSMGNGRDTVEARNHRDGCGIWSAIGRPWTNAGLVPGVNYGIVSPQQPAHGPSIPVMSPADFQKYCAAICVAVNTSHAVLKKGSKGNDVKTWQSGLAFGTGATISADGDFGPATDAATRNLQTFFRLQVDGIVGPKTRSTLVAVLFTRAAGK